jgi:hypothetical protein
LFVFGFVYRVEEFHAVTSLVFLFRSVCAGVWNAIAKRRQDVIKPANFQALILPDHSCGHGSIGGFLDVGRVGAGKPYSLRSGL